MFPKSLLRQVRSRKIYSSNDKRNRPTSSEVLTCYIKQCNEPPWTSYFVKYSSIRDDQWGKSHFNWKVGNSNYHILRTGCFPYIKYHCTKRKFQNLTMDDYFFRVIKVTNLGGDFVILSLLVSHAAVEQNCLNNELLSNAWGFIFEIFQVFWKQQVAATLFKIYVEYIMKSSENSFNNSDFTDFVKD